MFSSFFRQAEIPLKIMSLASRKTCVTNDKNERELKQATMGQKYL